MKLFFLMTDALDVQVPRLDMICWTVGHTHDIQVVSSRHLQASLRRLL